MEITRIEYDLVEVGPAEWGQTYRRLLDGRWEREVWDAEENRSWRPLREQDEFSLEAKYQQTISDQARNEEVT